MIGDVAWANNRSWVKSTNGMWSGYYTGQYKNLDEGWAFVTLADLESAFDFRWIVRDGKYLLADPKLEDKFETLDRLLESGKEDNHDLIDEFRELAAELLDVGL